MTPASEPGRFGPPVSVLDADPDLAEGIPADQLALARERAHAPTLDIERPSWDATSIAETGTPEWMGLLVLDGLLVRAVSVGERSAAELFGAGDIFRPWDRDGEYAPLTVGLRWIVPVPTRVAVLDAAFGRRMAPWPSFASQLVARAAQRARALALTQAISHLPRVQGRLLLLFWLLAERWGRVGRDGVHLSLPLTHNVLAMVVGAGRPTVTMALQALRHGGLLLREDDGRWLLTNAGIAALEDPESLERPDEALIAPAGAPPSPAPRA